MRAMIEKIGTCSRFCRDRDLAHHFLCRNNAATRRVPALFWEFLVFELDRGRAGALIAANGVAHVEQAAITGVAVGR